jgi:hypothetical protein
MKSLVALGAALVTAVVAVGCSAKDAAIAPTSVTLTFPSVAAAVASDAVQIQVFDETGASDLSGACEDLVAQVGSNQSLPGALVDNNTTACDLASGNAPFTVGVGARAFLVTASSNGTTILIGCSVENVAGGQLLVPVDLVPLSDSVVLPATSCTTLSDHCNGGC